MKPIKAAATSVTLASGVVGAYAGLALPSVGTTQLLLAAIGLVLVVDSIVCLYGASVAFAGSSVVSAVYLLVAVLGWSLGFSPLEVITIGLVVVDIPLGVIAYRSTTAIPEQANPMNLPVFG
jgi:hypothetical protein